MVLVDMDWFANSEMRGALSQCLSELGDSDGFSYKSVVASGEFPGIALCRGWVNSVRIARYVFTAVGRTADADQTNRAPVNGRRNGTSN